MFKKILVPVDAAEPAISEQGLVLAAEIAAMADGEVELINALPKIAEPLRELLPSTFDVDKAESVELQLRAMATKADLPRERVSYRLRTGTVDGEVLAEAEAWAADLIIIGSYSPSVSTYLLGSNAEKIVSQAKCSVLVVRPRKDEHGTYWLVPPIAS